MARDVQLDEESEREKKRVIKLLLLCRKAKGTE